MLCLKRWSEALVVLVGAGGGVAISQGLKQVFGRERPELVYRAVEAANPSFPSGHAMLSAVVFLTLGALAARFADRRKRVKALALGAAVLLSLLVGASRIYLGVHWTSDVLAGWSLGAAWAMACWVAAWAWERKVGRQKLRSSRTKVGTQAELLSIARHSCLVAGTPGSSDGEALWRAGAPPLRTCGG
jgi:undecaprenyl-diphosphatase